MTRIEMLLGSTLEWTALAHCDCGTTLTGKAYRPEDALGDVQDALDEHLAKGGAKCGTASHAQVECCCDRCRDHNRKLAGLIASTR